MDTQQEFLRHLLKHQGDLRAFIGSLVRDRHLCDDIFQDVVLVLWEKFSQYDRARSFGAWARGIAARKVMQAFAKNKRAPLTLSPDAIEAVARAQEDTATDWSEEEEALRHCLEKLPGESRRLVGMRYEDGLKLREMAQLCQSTLDAVHKALSRLRERLRDCVERQLAQAGGGVL